MDKYLITWNCGYGEEFDVVEAETFNMAMKMAYNTWWENLDQDYNAKLLTDNLIEEYGIGEDND